MDERNRPPEDTLLERDNLKFVMEQLEIMDPREAAVLRMRFGIGDCRPQTLKEIGETLGLTRERVRQIETDALSRLATALEEGRPITVESPWNF